MEDHTTDTPDIGPETAQSEALEFYSPLAAISLACMLLSFGGCLVTIALTLLVNSWAGLAMFALPVLSFIAVVTGLLGLVQISRSNGRISGRNAAFMGAVVGLILMVLQGSVVIGAVLPWFAIGNNLKPVMQSYANASESSDITALRAMLAPETSTALSDDQVTQFWSRAAPGGASGAEVSFDLGMFFDAKSVMDAAKSASSGDSINETMFPVRFEWPDGSDSLVYVIADAEALQGDSVLIVDLLVVDSSGEAVVLLPDGPAKGIVDMVGWKISK